MSSMTDEEINRLKTRIQELRTRIIPDLESQSEQLYARIIPLRKGTEGREKLEHEYKLTSKELRRRSDESINIRRDIEKLEFERSLKH
jgi:hypothetical protein